MKKKFLKHLLMALFLVLNGCYSMQDYAVLYNPLNVSVRAVEKTNNVAIDFVIKDPDNGLLSIYFKSYQHTTIEDARRLCVNVINDFLQNMQKESNKTIPPDDLNVYIYFLDKNSKFHLDQSPAAVVKEGDKMIYLHDKNNDDLDVLHEETYEEAVRIIQDE